MPCCTAAAAGSNLASDGRHAPALNACPGPQCLQGCLRPLAALLPACWPHRRRPMLQPHLHGFQAELQAAKRQRLLELIHIERAAAI